MDTSRSTGRDQRGFASIVWRAPVRLTSSIRIYVCMRIVKATIASYVRLFQGIHNILASIEHDVSFNFGATNDWNISKCKIMADYCFAFLKLPIWLGLSIRFNADAWIAATAWVSISLSRSNLTSDDYERRQCFTIVRWLNELTFTFELGMSYHRISIQVEKCWDLNDTVPWINKRYWRYQ